MRYLHENEKEENRVTFRDQALEEIEIGRRVDSSVCRYHHRLDAMN